MKSLLALLALSLATIPAQADFRDRQKAARAQQALESEARAAGWESAIQQHRLGVINAFAKKHGGFTNFRAEKDYGGATHYYFTTGDNLECERNFMNDFYTCYDASNQGYQYPDLVKRKKTKSTGSWIFDNIDRWYLSRLKTASGKRGEGVWSANSCAPPKGSYV